MTVGYHNTSDDIKILGEYGAVAAHEIAYTEKYVVYPDPAFAIVQELPAPWVKLSVAAAGATVSSLAKYPRVRIYNQTSSSIGLVVNGDASNDGYSIPAGAIEILTHDREINSITTSGAGSGNVSIHGFVGVG